MAATYLFPNPKAFSPLLTNPPSIPSIHSTQVPFLSSLDHQPHNASSTRRSVHTNAKKNPWLDPFDDGEDPTMEYGSLFSDGKQEEDPRPPDDPNNPYGFLKFPAGYSVEIASLALKVRGDVRRCCCVISGGVYENLLFFPAIQLLKDRYPGVQIDVLASERGKQTYELNKNVRWANVYDPDDYFPEPAEYTDMIGVLKNRYYDMILSTKLAGLGHAAFLFMTTARDRVSYVYPNVNAAGAGLLLSETFKPDRLNLSEGGYNMYHQMVDWLGRPFRSVPRQPLPPLRVSLSRKLKDYVEEKYKKAGAEKGKYIVIHGVQSDSKASMQSKGDTDGLLPIEVWAQIVEEIRDFRPVFVIPHERDRENVVEVIGEDASIVFITTPGQLAALINDSAGVIATNTAAIQLAHAREKPSIGLFGSKEKGDLFVPQAKEKKCTVISSKTGKLIDIDVEAVKNAIQTFNVSLALV
ncbi:photosynthetic NDH subunit of subcomplex B 1, chloroplastic-like [Neltuma alba]|uniref:photosynthetic NDH subunit of subcomplex B 1, chloroplastic-like n=1 Tax=Neltuma alba TaxID=207710 RepID=UPI0010A40705|nr:photosynthetic NDH subunit of subcomplex B 1, chloroplastic-like [Prosopis alba]XP_028782970.1 photosynthetic NDH subunit of subcomplex B 1, chloroplastic-like [Prosopis alba]